MNILIFISNLLKIKTELPNLKTLEKIHENNYDTNQPIIKIINSNH